MGIKSAQIGSFFTKLIQKGDPRAAMAAGKGPVTTEWAAEHGYTQYRSPSVKDSLGLAREATSLYKIYAQDKERKKRIKEVKKDTKKKKLMAEERRQKSRLLRRPSRERGIL